MTTAFIGLGSNQGDREAFLRRAVQALSALPGTEVTRVSSVYDSDPVGRPGQPPYLNAVARLDTDLPAAALLSRLQEIEARLGRPRSGRGGPRTIDLDLLFFGRERLREPGLEVPHPRYAGRAFVVVPLAEMDPAWTDPRTGLRMDTLLRECGGLESVRWKGRLS